LEAVAFMENVVGDEDSVLDRMICRYPITPDIGEARRRFGHEPRQTRTDIKIILEAKTSMKWMARQ
jgi:hypothetical protein